jgi:hypothetical protein
MNDPFDDIPLTNSNSITVEWNPLTGSNTGNSPILSYKLEWDAGTGTVNITLIEALITNYTVTGLTEG